MSGFSRIGRLFAAFAGLAVLLWAGGCGRDAGPAGRPEVFIFARGSDAQKLDPADVDDGDSVNALAQVCEGLVRFRSGTLEIEPCLAEDYSFSADGLSYTFRLRAGVRFHDGTPLTAEAAAWSFRRQMDPRHPGRPPGAAFPYWKSLYGDIAAVETPDERTLVFRLRRPNAALLSSLAVFPAWLLSPQAFATHGEAFQRHPVGTGPYRFLSWTPNQAIVLEANPDYWDAPRRPQFQRLVLKVVPENSVRLLELKTGAVHGLDGLMPAELAALEGDARFTVYREPGMNLGYLVMNLADPRFQAREVREAIALAIDRDRLAEVALGGAGRRADYPMPPGFLGYPETPDALPFDPERSRAILEAHPEARSRPIRLQVMTAPRPFLPDPVQAASLIRAQLEAVGLPVEIVAMDFKSHLSRLRDHDYEMAIIGWIGDNGDPDNFLSVFFGSWAAEPGVATNYAGYRNPEMDRLLLDGRRETDPVRRAALYREALALWRRDLPIIPLVHGDTIVVMRREVTGFRVQRTGDLQLGGIGWAAGER